MQENQRVSRGQLLVPARRPVLSLTLCAKIEAEIETTRADIRGLRAQWRTKREEIKARAEPADLRAGRSSTVRPSSPRRRSPRRRSSRKRAWASTSRASASRRRRRTCSRIEARAGRRSQDPRRRSSAREADDGGARGGAAAASPHHHRVAARRHRLQAAGARQLRHRRRAGDGGGGRHRSLDRGQLQGNRAHPRAAGPEGGRSTSTPIPTPNARGTVASIAQATGAEFAVLPPQNASGNWVKVVQRIPVRVSVTCREGDPPLARRHEHDGRDRHRPQPHSMGGLLSSAGQVARPRRAHRRALVGHQALVQWRRPSIRRPRAAAASSPSR